MPRLGPEYFEHVLANKYLQNGNPRNYKNPPLKRRMGHLIGLQRHYFHISISPRSRKYLRFHLNGQTYQVTSLPFHPCYSFLEFTKVMKEVKLIAQAKGLRIHQYHEDWLLRAPSQESYLQHTKTLLALCYDLGWVVT